jgi:hypothetical protein
MKFILVETVLAQKTPNPTASYYIPMEAIANLRAFSSGIYIVTLKPEYKGTIPGQYQELKFTHTEKNILIL